ncbi:MAG: Uma2 family endonuclease [Trichocoleus desertorum ATA4-8-CV12]|jgi:Uma2 family endonuclease|nr:Uma2 family endonuclease [Trichocoleus desertorum ATA4-8-CV12]
MSIAKDFTPTNDEWEEIVFPPSDLLSDEPPWETDLHLRQMVLLIQCLEWLWREGGPTARNDFYASGNLTIYYSPQQIKSRDFRGPDFFVVLGTERKPRKSWVIWEENGKYPNVIVEILSGSTAATDRGLKKQLYQDTFRTPDYFWFAPETLEFAGFFLTSGQYQAIEPNPQGWLWSQQLGLYLGIYEDKLRFFTADGKLVSSPQEAAELAQQQVEVAQQQVEIAQQQAEDERRQKDLLLAKLRERGIDPNAL